MKKQLVLWIIAPLLSISPVFATVQLASGFSDHMVLQRGKPVPVWGTGSVGESVHVSFAGQNKPATVDVDGKWRVDLDSMTANATEQNLVLTGPSNTITLNGILIGDVWLASGQSNMKFTLNQCVDTDGFVANADNDQIRFLNVPKWAMALPQDSFNKDWQKSTATGVPLLSAIAVIFSQRVQPAIGVPLGVIICADGSTATECWVSNETFAADPFAATKVYWDAYLNSWEANKAGKLQAKLDAHIATPSSAAAYDMRNPTNLRTYPTGCYNAMLHPLFPYSLTGIIWRQGEANDSRAVQYQDLMPVMLQEWRTNFEQDDMPFLQAQLPGYRSVSSSPGASAKAELREAQYLLTQSETNVFMAVLIDGNDALTGNTTPTDVHAKNKHLDGERLAVLALAEVYGQTLAHQGPIYRDMQIEGASVRISYDHVNAGLLIGSRESYTSLTVIPTPTADLEAFAIAGSDQTFYNATAVLDGTNVVVSSPQVASPVAVRYAWADNGTLHNLYNVDGFPAAPFRTDDWTLSTEGVVSVNPTFEVYSNGVVLVASKTGSGQVTRTPDTPNYFESGDYGVYPAGTSVDLLAVPENEWMFNAWSGDVSGTQNALAVVVDTEKSVMASFVPDVAPAPPAFVSNPIFVTDAVAHIAYVNTLLDYASDANGDTLQFTVVNGPTWLVVASNGTLSGTPTLSDLGVNRWTVQVSDGQGGMDEATLALTVLAEGITSSDLIQFGGNQYAGALLPDRKLGWNDTYTIVDAADGTPAVDTRWTSNGSGGFADIGGKIYDNSPDIGNGAGSGLIMTLVSAYKDLNGGANQSLGGNGWVDGTYLELSFNKNVILEDVWFPQLSTGADEQVTVLHVVNGITNTVATVTDLDVFTFAPDTEIAADTILRFEWKDGATSTTASYFRSLTVRTASDLVGITPVLGGHIGDSGTNMVLQWPGMAGRSYRFRSTTNLITGVWATNVVSGVEPFTVHTTTLDSAQCFFQVELVK